MGFSAANAAAIYSLFAEPVLQGTMLGFLCNPLALIPSLLFNYFLLSEYNIMFYAKRDMAINMWLLPQGKQVIVETYNGQTRKIHIKDIYKFETKKTKFRLGNRLEIYHGANNYLFLSGNPHYLDQEILESICNKSFIDTKNVTFDIDLDKSFTCEIDNLMKSDLKKVRIFSNL